MVNVAVAAPSAGAGPVREAVDVCIGIGANLGDARAMVEHQLHHLGDDLGAQVSARSRLYTSPPLVDAGTREAGPPYVNAVLRVLTRLSAPDLLERLQAIETAAGRTRPHHHAPRTLDLDLLLYGQAFIASPRLTVPHPRLHERAFVLAPLADVGRPCASAAVVAGLMQAQHVQALPPGA